MLRADAAIKATAVAAQAASATNAMTREPEANAGKSASRDSRNVVTAYMPSGKTMLHSIGV